MTWKTTFNSSALTAQARRASEAAARATAAELNSRFQDAIGAKVWQWPRETIRSNNKPVGSPRTIVDSGELRNSNKMEINGLTVRFRWTAPYAAANHEGARLRNGGLLPARPWTSAVLGTTPTPGIPVYDWRKRFRETWLNHFNA